MRNIFIIIVICCSCNKAQKEQPTDDANEVSQDTTLHQEKNAQQPISDLIRLEKPLQDSKITSPVEISGSARGQWYFEGSFPIKLVDSENNVLAEGIAEAEGEWMTTEFVPFKVTLEYSSPGNEKGFLIFKKSNASGRPALDRTYRHPVVFKQG